MNRKKFLACCRDQKYCDALPIPNCFFLQGTEKKQNPHGVYPCGLNNY
jgi:hypothetical protein